MEFISSLFDLFLYLFVSVSTFDFITYLFTGLLVMSLVSSVFRKVMYRNG